MQVNLPMFRIKCIFAPTNQIKDYRKLIRFPKKISYENPYFNSFALFRFHIALC